MDTFHVPILVKEIIELALRVSPRNIFDGTLGDGGHSLVFLEEFPQARLIATDRDPDMLLRARTRLSPYESRIELINDNYSNILKTLNPNDVVKFDFVLLDLGIASFHLDDAKRGFSFSDDGELDMRLDKQGMSAMDLINEMDEKELADIIYLYGEEKRSRAIARMIVKGRKWTRARDLAQSIMNLHFAKSQHSRNKKGTKHSDRKGRNIHPATRTFQALRIAVNRELDHLKLFLEKAPDLMGPDSILAIISFHSLEDRLVKWYMRYWADPFSLPRDIPVPELQKKFADYSNMIQNSKGKIITKRPIVPSDNEIFANPRARSAKLRVFHFLSADNKNIM